MTAVDVEPRAGDAAGEVCPGRPNPRVVRSQAAILDATVALIAEHGVSGLTVEAVAAKAGVGKATVYRHWPSRASLVLAAVESVLVNKPNPDTGNLRADIRSAMIGVIDICCQPPMSQVLPSLIDASERDPELAALHQQFTAQRRKPLGEILERAVERGDLDPSVDLSLIADLVVGPIFYRRLVRREPPDEAYVDRLLAMIDPLLGT